MERDLDAFLGMISRAGISYVLDVDCDTRISTVTLIGPAHAVFFFWMGCGALRAVGRVDEIVTP